MARKHFHGKATLGSMLASKDQDLAPLHRLAGYSSGFKLGASGDGSEHAGRKWERRYSGLEREHVVQYNLGVAEGQRDGLEFRRQLRVALEGQGVAA